MFKGKNIQQLKELSEISRKSIEQLNIQTEILRQALNESIKKADIKDKPTLEQLKVLTTKVINLAKQGKASRADELIKNFNNGNNSNK